MKNTVIFRIRTIFTVFFLLCIGLMCILNFKQFCIILQQDIVDSNANGGLDFSSVDSALRENVSYKKELTNIYGIYQRFIKHTIVGNFEYVADEYGILHMINDTKPYNTDNFLSEMRELKEYADEMQTPLIYVQAPNREIVNGNVAIRNFNVDDETMDIVVSNLRKMIPVLDLRKNLSDNDINFALKDLYFHTDLHMQTEAEIWMAYQVGNYLKTDFHLPFDELNYYFDMSNYDKKSYDFVGNYARTYGEYFVKKDKFSIYHPKFDTSYTFSIPGNSESIKNGNFDEIMLNGYEKVEHDSYTYWVTNYMHFMEPYYNYTNNDKEDINLLIITDSIAYRGLAHLSLNTHNLTILDPRFFGDNDYIRNVMKNQKYDAVIVWQACYLIDSPFLLK